MVTSTPFSGIRGNHRSPIELTMNEKMPTRSEEFVLTRLNEIQYGGNDRVLTKENVFGMQVLMPSMNYIGVRKNKVYPEAKFGFLDKDYSSSLTRPEKDILLPPPTYTIGNNRPLTSTRYNNAL